MLISKCSFKMLNMIFVLLVFSSQLFLTMIPLAVIFVLHGCLCTIADNDVKRLLLNDPDVIAERLTRLEGTVAILDTTVKQLTTENQQHKNHIQHLETALRDQHNFGSTYIRWGKSKCPANNMTELIYSGFAGGGHYNEKGNAAEYVCLPPDPNFVKTKGPDHGRMYGAEYDSSNFFASHSHDEDVPCVLCRSLLASSVIMIPGKNKCYSGWKMEYHGYLASAHHVYPGQTSYACLDINPEYILGGVANHNGKLFNNVVAKCGSLKCPPYINDYPLTCVVCSK